MLSGRSCHIVCCFLLSISSAVFVSSASASRLHDAVIEQDHEAVQKLLMEGDDPNEKMSEWGIAPLKIAAALGSLRIVELLITAGADVNLKDSTGSVPLHAAAEKGNREIIAILLRHGADVNASDDMHGVTPLHVAIFSARAGTVEYLLDNGADANYAGKRGQTPMRTAIEKGDAEIIRLLETHGSAKHKVGKELEHAALFAYYSGYFEYLSSEFNKHDNSRAADTLGQRSVLAKRKSMKLGIGSKELRHHASDGKKQAELDVASERNSNMEGLAREMDELMTVYSD